LTRNPKAIQQLNHAEAAFQSFAALVKEYGLARAEASLVIAKNLGAPITPSLSAADVEKHAGPRLPAILNDLKGDLTKSLDDTWKSVSEAFASVESVLKHEYQSKPLAISIEKLDAGKNAS
jgi:hypothetical protein